jgi:hypothetical protein
LAEHPKLLAGILQRQEASGLPRDVPKIITEYGYSPFGGQVELELPGAMIDAETAVLFFMLGGETSYFYGLEPNWVFQEEQGKPCDTWGNLMILQFYDDFKIRPLATFRVAQLLTKQWIQPGTDRHTVYPAVGNLVNKDNDPLVTAYAVRRPDGRLAVMLFNKDANRSLTVRLQWSAGGATKAVAGPIDVYQYSSEQWDWVDEKGEGNGGYPARDDLPAESVLQEGQGAIVTLPPYSVSVLRTRGDGGYGWTEIGGIEQMTTVAVPLR